MIALLNVLFLATPTLPPHGAAHLIESLNVPSEMYWSAANASGARLCDPELREKQGKAFDGRFGPVVLAVIKEMNADKNVPKDKLIVTSSCRSFSNSDEADKSLSRSLDDFEPVIRKMQLRYDIYCWEIFCHPRHKPTD